MSPLLEVRDLKKHFPIYKGVFSRVSDVVYAVDGVSFHIDRGETLGLVGESGCGKSTVGRTLLKLLEPTEGKIFVRGEDITGLGAAQMLPYRRQMQMIYQDPYASLNPRMSAGEIVGEAADEGVTGAGGVDRLNLDGSDALRTVSCREQRTTRAKRHDHRLDALLHQVLRGG